MRKWTGALVASTVLALAACTAQPAETGQGDALASGDSVVVGVMQDMTGPIASYGQAIHKGAELAVEQFNAAGGVNGAKVEIKDYDLASNKSNTAQAMRSLTADGAVAILGPTSSSALVLAAPVSQQTSVVTLAPTSAENFKEGTLNDWTYRVAPVEAKTFADTLGKVRAGTGNPTRIALFYDPANNSSIEERGLLEQNAAAGGYQVVATATVPEGQTDVAGAVSTILAGNPDAVFISHLPAESAAFMKEVRARGSNVQFMGGPAFSAKEVFSLAGPAGEGAVTFVPFLATSTEPASKAFVEAYRAKFGSDPDQFAALGHDGMLALLEGLKASGSTSRDGLKNALNGISGLAGATGPITYGKGSDNSTAQYTVVRVQSGAFVEIA
ncbi:MAG: ABC transporter substrate-binding protein [Pseudonocardia sp.]|uniref:ABC transporter substrate-binding protein n=1 Tax=unclassified Pseudonocardia TaxID=2619320 RepID=UPI00086890C4|nr:MULTISPECIES: ABC transporter substrate-binding protein [unclassified Pseudonocardia]MBN9109360.1 ABC transporter substrate-binding protein [Pseudonocardia sp.]ODU29502.1 MAG: hypothetical protein ABS80_01730 [Pseudonocardia sp. SCN 72-51]ODV08072.1 MAG: hypothetical protein ABT15_05110 [Pseudonocardia sp. SCN 73-27]